MSDAARRLPDPAPAQTPVAQTEAATAPATAPPPATPASPAGALHFPGRPAACLVASVLLWVAQGLGMNLVAVNTAQLQGAFGVTSTEISWLVAAYMVPNVSLTILLTKIRTQFGLRPFAEVAICVFVSVSLLHLVVHDFGSALIVRFLAGMAAAPMSTLGFLYMLEAFPQAKKLSWGVSLALTCSAATAAIARIVSPFLLDQSSWSGLYSLEVGCALLALMAVLLVPLAPVPHARVLHRLDFVSYPLVATGFGLVAVVLVLGRAYWWFEAPWIGACLAVAALSLAAAAAIELNRTTPLLDIAWLVSPEMVRFGVTLLLFRLVLAEQSSGAIGLFQQIGLLNEQSRTLYLVTLTATVGGGILCALTIRADRAPLLQAAALAMIATGAFLDSRATSLTRPEEMLVSQGMIALGAALFLPPTMLAGLMMTLKRGPTLITSFIAVFLATQSLGGLMGSAAFGTLVTIRQKMHLRGLADQMILSNPLISHRIEQLGGIYSATLADRRLLNAEGVSLLVQQAGREAWILAYNDAFLLIAAIAAAALIWIVSQEAATRIRALVLRPHPAGA